MHRISLKIQILRLHQNYFRNWNFSKELFLNLTRQYPTVVLRHRKENLKKCSLTGLESRKDMCFFCYPTDILPDLSEYVLLAMNAPSLSKDDGERGLFLIDATWRYAEKMDRFVASHQQVAKRSLPSGWKTAYPRKQEDCPDPEHGLASIEALFAAYHILGWSTEGLLDHYYWKDLFIQKNEKLISFNHFE